MCDYLSTESGNNSYANCVIFIPEKYKQTILIDRSGKKKIMIYDDDDYWSLNRVENGSRGWFL
jgi:hypothetical protein